MLEKVDHYSTYMTAPGVSALTNKKNPFSISEKMRADVEYDQYLSFHIFPQSKAIPNNYWRSHVYQEAGGSLADFHFVT